ncbi:MAG: ABC transporter permease, partial [Chromatiales bacterium]|nr:ABC transporter permease [Chromatiales bacterium]
MTGALRYSWVTLAREWRAGELRVLAAALLIAVAAVSSVSFFTDRVQRAMALQATELLGADLVVVSPQAPPDEWADEARRRGLDVARTVTFPSVALAGDVAQLAEVKAVSAAYPLRGRLRVTERLFGDEMETDAVPARGEAWADPRLLQQLAIDLGSSLELGAVTFHVGRVLTYEPDRGGDLFSIAPRLMLNLEDLAATELITPASRVRHHFLVAGGEAQVNGFRRWIEPRLAPNQSVQDIRDGRPELRVALERAEQFLGLAALVAVLLAGAAIAVAARHYSERQADVSAVMRCLGAGQPFVLQVYLLRLLWIGLLASLGGAAIGYVAQGVLALLLAQWFEGGLPAAGITPLFAGLAVGVVTVLGFALPPILRLGQVPPLRVLRRDLGLPPPATWLVFLLALAALGGLLLWQAGDARLAVRVLGGGLATGVALWLTAWGLIRLLRPLRTRGGVAVRFGLANLSRRGGMSAVQLSAFGLGIMALLLLALVRVDLLDAWESNLPPDAPNHFMINLQPDQVDGMRALFDESGIVQPAFYPMVRGRLVAINDRRVEPGDFEDGQIG